MIERLLTVTFIAWAIWQAYIVPTKCTTFHAPRNFTEWREGVVR